MLVALPTVMSAVLPLLPSVRPVKMLPMVRLLVLKAEAKDVL